MLAKHFPLRAPVPKLEARLNSNPEDHCFAYCWGSRQALTPSKCQEEESGGTRRIKRQPSKKSCAHLREPDSR